MELKKTMVADAETREHSDDAIPEFLVNDFVWKLNAITPNFWLRPLLWFFSNYSDTGCFNPAFGAGEQIILKRAFGRVYITSYQRVNYRPFPEPKAKSMREKIEQLANRWLGLKPHRGLEESMLRWQGSGEKLTCREVKKWSEELKQSWERELAAKGTTVEELRRKLPPL